MDGNLLSDGPFKIAKLTGPLEPCDGHARRTGSCGDTMEFWLRADQKRIVRATYRMDGCEATKACGDMAATLATGRQIEEVLRMTPIEILGKLPGLSEESHHCAYLALETLQAACRDRISRAAAADSTVSSEAGCTENARTPSPGKNI